MQKSTYSNVFNALDAIQVVLTYVKIRVSALYRHTSELLKVLNARTKRRKSVFPARMVTPIWNYIFQK